jgi:predicted TIM-barrel fold metal-dependent hydrolase
MGHTLRLLLVLVVAVAAAVLAQTQAPKAAAPKAQVKYGITVKAGPMDAILLKDYKPDSSLVVPVTRLAEARYPVIDIHSHSSMNVMKTPADVDAWVRRMDEVGVERSVVFTEAVGANFDRQVDLFLKRYPDRFQVWCGMDTANIEAPDYPERAARELERCFRLGARGVGEITDKGWGVQASEAKALPRAKRLRLDDPRLDKFWQKCAELNIPINVHIADHPSCWQPLGPKQERTPDFQGFNLHGKDVPSYEELLLTRDRMLARHPRTRFILCHLSNQGNDLAALAKVLDRYPNAFVDISARDYEIGRSPRAAARFIARYRDRVMFGTDMGWERHMYEAWWRLLETGDEYMPGRIWWRYYGLELPDDLLKSLYRDNALRLLNWSK